MKKVLIITFHFPPSLAIGARRPFGIAKYLPKYGWEPIVLTPKIPGDQPEGIRVITTDCRDIIASLKSRLMFNTKKGLHKQFALSVSNSHNRSTWKRKVIGSLKEMVSIKMDWYKFALESGSKFLDTERIDAIISTSPPISTHLIAKRLKKNYKIPWIADVRDPWSQSMYRDRPYFIRYFEKRFEFKVLSDADILVTVTNPMIDILKELHKDKQIVCITNGYDENEFSKLQIKLTDKFTITYTGLLHNGKRDPEPLFKALSELINENKINRDLIEIRFYVQDEIWLLEEVKKYKLEGIVHINEYVPRDEVLKKQCESQLLLILRWDDKNEEIFCPGKIYEYLGAKRPIIVIGYPGGVVQDIIEKTNAGKLTKDINDLKKVIMKYYHEFVESGEIKCHSNSNIKNYTYDLIAKRYSDILNNLI